MHLTEQEQRLADLVAARTVLPVEGVEVQAAVARIFDLPCADIVGPSRKARLVDARSVIAYILTERGWTYPEVGELLNRDASTVHHLCQRIKRDRELRSLAGELVEVGR